MAMLSQHKESSLEQILEHFFISAHNSSGYNNPRLAYNAQINIYKYSYC